MRNWRAAELWPWVTDILLEAVATDRHSDMRWSMLIDCGHAGPGCRRSARLSPAYQAGTAMTVSAPTVYRSQFLAAGKEATTGRPPSSSPLPRRQANKGVCNAAWEEDDRRGEAHSQAGGHAVSLRSLILDPVAIAGILVG